MLKDMRLEQLNILVPEMKSFLSLRYRVLRNLYYFQPVGRRLLARYLSETERVLRKELDLLKKQGLVKVSRGGMELTPEGMNIVLNMRPYLHKLLGLTDLEEKLKGLLQVKEVIVVSGDMEVEQAVRYEVGRAGAQALCQSLRDNVVIAFSGGTTCAAVAEMMPFISEYKGLKVVPARGSFGEEIPY